MTRELLGSALHEAGHALMAVATGADVEKVELHPYGGGTCTIRTPSWWDLSVSMLRLRIRSYLSGVAAETVVVGRRTYRAGAADDNMRAQKLALTARQRGARPAVGTIIRQERAIAEEYFSAHRHQLERLAEELHKRRSMSGNEVSEVLGLVAGCNYPAAPNPQRRRYERAA